MYANYSKASVVYILIIAHLDYSQYSDKSGAYNTYKLATQDTDEDTTPSAVNTSSISYSNRNGGYSEADLTANANLGEEDYTSLIDAATINDFDQSQTKTLSDWKSNVESQKQQEGGLVHILRAVIQFVGIIMVIWVSLLYLAYWFDRLNSIKYLNVLGFLTLGNLRISDEEISCTYDLVEDKKTRVITVNHRAIVKICLIAMFVGVLIMTGTLYKIVISLMTVVWKAYQYIAKQF